MSIETFVRFAFRIAIGATVTFALCAVLSTFLWTWLAYVLALVLSLVADVQIERRYGSHIDGAAASVARGLGGLVAKFQRA
jgi:hypothetical protein